MRHVRNPPGGKEENKAWWKQRKVIGGLAGAVITPLIVAWLIFLLGPPSSSGPAVTPRPTPKCSTDKAIGYRKPTQLEALDKTSLAICSVDVNNGQPIGRSISLSGTVLGICRQTSTLQLYRIQTRQPVTPRVIQGTGITMSWRKLTRATIKETGRSSRESLTPDRRPYGATSIS